ncbi:MAG TPA: VOC family protein [Acidimicrobiales bacterium]
MSNPTSALPLSGDGNLARSDVQVRLPAQDLERARRWYAEKLGLEPVEEREGGLRYRCGSTLFSLFASSGAPSGTHTQMAWKVADIEATVAELRARGVELEVYELPGTTERDGIVDIPGTYPSEGGVGERAVWFRDSEGNVMGVGQAVAAPGPA